MGTYIAGVSPLEASLMARVQDREEGAFHELFARFKHKIFRTALRILKEEHSAEDATQETLVNVYRAADKFRGDSKIGTWINRITVNVCLEILRKNKKHDQRTEEDVSTYSFLSDSPRKNPYETLRQTEIGNRVHTALAQLGPKHQDVVRLHDLEGYTIREIAEILEVPEGTVKSRLFYGREELKNRLAAQVS
jgi:RNA polymerase sigma-70 factor (ECF subfamily)